MRTRGDRQALRHVVGLALIAFILPGSASAAELSVTAGDGSGRVFVWKEIEYAITVTNAGPDVATDVRVRLTVPKQVETLRASGTMGECSIDSTSTTCNVAALEAGGVASFTVVGRPTAPGRVVADVDVQGVGAPDANPADDSARVVTRVRLVRGACSNLRRGGAARDLLGGTRGGDAIFGRGGDDVIRGGPGDDCLSGQGGDDTLRGGRDDDTLFGDAGADVIDGGGGVDLAMGGGGPDRIKGAEEVRAGPGNDRIVAPRGARVRCGGGQDVVRLLGTADLSGCERVIPAPAPSSPPSSGGGGGGGVVGGGGGGSGGGFTPRSRHRRCSRRYCKRGGIPASIAPVSTSAIDAARRPRP